MERTSSTSGKAYITASIGYVINCSTSSEAKPCASVLICTCTLVTSGNASRLSLGTTNMAYAIEPISNKRIKKRLCVAASIILGNITQPQWLCTAKPDFANSEASTNAP